MGGAALRMHWCVATSVHGGLAWGSTAVATSGDSEAKDEPRMIEYSMSIWIWSHVGLARLTR